MYCEAPEFAGRELDGNKGLACLHIGDVGVSVSGDWGLGLSSELEKFRVSQCDMDVDVNVNVRWVQLIHPSRGTKTFHSGAVWTLARENDELIFDFSTPAVGRSPYKQLRTLDFSSAQMHLNSALLPRDAWPLEYPADELLITNYLAHHALGVEVHGCGLVDPEHGGFLFLGHSGAGKSTTTRLWKSAGTPEIPSPEILSDDRIILRLNDGELWMYGTPWHGEAAFASASKSKLNRIFILQHGESNKIAPLSRAQAVGELFARCFPPFHTASGLQNTVEFLERVVETVPCYVFQFVPDASAVEAALSFHD
jgi:hypothetical protein